MMRRDRVEMVAMQLYMMETMEAHFFPRASGNAGGGGAGGAGYVVGNGGGGGAGSTMPEKTRWELLPFQKRNEYRYRAMDLIREKMIQ